MYIVKLRHSGTYYKGFLKFTPFIKEAFEFRTLLAARSLRSNLVYNSFWGWLIFKIEKRSV